MKIFNKKIISLVLIGFFSSTFLYADLPRYIDFSKVLNESKAGKEAQEYLKKKFETDGSKFKKKESELKKLEQDLIAKKKVISNDEYKKEVEKLRTEVGKLRKDRQDSLANIANLRGKAKTELLKNLNPIIADYMKENKILLVLDKKGILLGDTGLDITSDIIKILNKELKSLNIK